MLDPRRGGRLRASRPHVRPRGEARARRHRAPDSGARARAATRRARARRGGERRALRARARGDRQRSRAEARSRGAAPRAGRALAGRRRVELAAQPSACGSHAHRPHRRVRRRDRRRGHRRAQARARHLPPGLRAARRRRRRTRSRSRTRRPERLLRARPASTSSAFRRYTASSSRRMPCSTRSPIRACSRRSSADSNDVTPPAASGERGHAVGQWRCFAVERAKTVVDANV